MQEEFEKKDEENSGTSTESADDSKSASKKLINDLMDIAESVISSVFVVLLIFTFLFRIATVSGSSMVKTLYDGDKLIISDLFYEPEQGDIVIINYPINGNDYIVKRIIATEGQVVSVELSDNGNVLICVDGVALEEDYISEPMLPAYFEPITVGEGQVFVMGDNRNHSTDSRYFGPIDVEKITGKVILRYYPFGEFKILS